MKFNISIPKGLKHHVVFEIEEYRKAFGKRQFQNAWNHLENAHVLGQAYPWQHTYVHWLMFRFGLKTKNTKEIIGQIPRLLVGGVKSFVGDIPVGNTGGSNVPPLKPMSIRKDLAEILDKYR